jgi:hypothetical protein
MGKLNNHERHFQKTPPQTFPKYSSPGLVVGKVSSNLIANIYTPKFLHLATKTAEQYADDFMHYEEALHATSNQSKEEAELEPDGTVQMAQDIQPPTPPLFYSQRVIDEFMDVMTDTSKHFSAPKNAWKVHVNAAKFERQLDEKYGIFRPFITNHPEIETFVRSVQRRYAMGYFSPFRRGDPPIPRTTAVIILFMMQRNGVRWDAIILAALFSLIGLQPWALIAVISLVNFELNKRKKKLVGGMNPVKDPVEAYYHSADDSGHSSDAEKETKRKMSILLEPVGTKIGANEDIDTSSYDTLILGSGPTTLYTASLLSRIGRKILLLCPEDDASGCLTLEHCKKPELEKKYRSVPFDVGATNVARLSRQQQMMSYALCTSTDYQGGIRFAQIGTSADGHAFEILSIPGMGTDGSSEPIPFVLRADGGAIGLMDDAATYLGDGWPGTGDDIGNSLSGAYLQACTGMNASAGEFFLSKILTDRVNDMRSRSTYQESAIRYTANFLDKCFPLNAHLRSLFAGIGMKDENINPSSTSMGPHVTNVCSSLSGEGMHYPLGGPRALCNAFASVVEQCGGKILTGVAVQELVFEAAKGQKPKAVKKEGEEEEGDAPRCIGVKLSSGRTLTFAKEILDDKSTAATVLSMHGFVHTFIRLMPEDVRIANKVPRGLPALSEQRPVFKVLFAINGSSEELDVTGADFYRLPGASLSMDEKDPSTGTVRLGEVGSMIGDHKDTDEKENVLDEKTVVETANSTAMETKPDVKAKKRKRSKFETGVSWMKISFPSAKDPTFSARHGCDATTCVVTIEADDDFVMLFDTKPKLFAILKDRAGDAGNRQRLLDRVQKDLLDIYPQLEGTKRNDCILMLMIHFVTSISLTWFFFAQEKLTTLRFAGHFIGASVTIQSVTRQREFAPILPIPVCSWEALI